MSASSKPVTCGSRIRIAWREKHEPESTRFAKARSAQLGRSATRSTPPGYGATSVAGWRNGFGGSGSTVLCDANSSPFAWSLGSSASIGAASSTLPHPTSRMRCQSHSTHESSASRRAPVGSEAGLAFARPFCFTSAASTSTQCFHPQSTRKPEARTKLTTSHCHARRPHQQWRGTPSVELGWQQLQDLLGAHAVEVVIEVELLDDRDQTAQVAGT